jgi:3-oxoacyl-[acyl-carrier protein] reductase
MLADLQGKVALVTGASRGIGRGAALALAEAGADVAVNYRIQEKQALEVCEQIRDLGPRTVAVGADVSQAREVNRMVEAVEWELGPVDILINNAGMLWQKPLEEITEEDFDAMIAANLKSAFLVTQRVLPAMREKKWGRIVNLSSVAAQTGGVTGPHYAASKAGMHGLTHSYARQLVKEGITVNTVSPALIETDMIAQNLQVTPEVVPVGRFGAVAEVAQVIVMLARNSYITGQTINVNGGWYMS